MTLIPYPGLKPSNVNRDAKYSVVNGPSGAMVVRLRYPVGAREVELLTTEHHDELVEMVNRAKVEATGQAGGVFYVNEHGHVVVPGAGTACYYAGPYDRLLEFEFEGGVVGPRPPDGLAPGDLWPGPHVGIKYTLAAGGKDIFYKQMVTPTRERKVELSTVCSHRRSEVVGLAQRLASVKGQSGGVIYINEAGEFFAPVDDGLAYKYLYLGALDDAPWFPVPDVPDL